MSDSVETPAAPAAPATTTNELPDWARKQISDANQDAAKHRVQLKAEKEAREALEEKVATLTSEKSQVESTHTTVQSDFDKLVTAIQAEVPHQHIFAFAKTLNGSTADELTAHANELMQMFGSTAGPSPAVDRSQGLGDGTATNSDPASEFASFLQTQLN